MVYRDPLVTQEKVRRMVRHRRRMHRAKIASLIFLVLVVVGAAAIGIDRGVVFARHLWAEHHRPAAPPSTTTTTAATTTTIAGPPRCASAQLNAYLYNWRITDGTLYEVVVLADTLATPCTLDGYVGFSVTAAGGGTLPAPVHDDPILGAAAGASAVPVTVVSGQRAWFEFTYPVTCATVLSPGQASSGAPGECYEGAFLGVIVSQATMALEVIQPLRFTYGTAGFTVGPFGSGTPPASPPVG
jgi:hypothetical protein